MTAGAPPRSSLPRRASASPAAVRPSRSKASCARVRNVAGSAFRLSARRAREMTSGGELERSSRTTSTGNSAGASVAGRNPSQEAISWSAAPSAAGITKSAETVTAAVYVFPLATRERGEGVPSRRAPGQGVSTDYEGATVEIRALSAASSSRLS